MTEETIKTGDAEEKLEAIFNSVRDGLVVFDKTGKLLQASKSLIELGGYSEEEIIGRGLKFLTMFTPKSLALITINFVKTLADNEISPYEVEATTKDGKKVFLEISGTPLKSKGEIVGVVAITHDITEKKKTAEELKNRNEELEKFNKLVVGRELKIVELKEKIKELEEGLNKK